MAWLAGWGYRKRVTVSTANVDADLTDYPLLVRLAADADVGAHALASGYDVRFTAADGTTPLKYERQSFAVAAGVAAAVFWVKVPAVAGAADTDLYLYYGYAPAADGQDVANTWDSGFVAVWHFDEASGAAVDSKSGLSAALQSTATRAAGQVGQALSLNGTTDYALVPSPSVGNLGSTGTTEAWLKPSATLSSGGGRKDAHNKLYGPYLMYDYVAGKLTYVVYNAATTEYNPGSVTGLTAGTWYYAAGTHDASTALFYLNGVQAESQAASMASPKLQTGASAIGAQADGLANYWPGRIDEVRISSVRRSAEWLKFTYYNLSSGTNELTFGAEEAAPPGPDNEGMYGVSMLTDWPQSTARRVVFKAFLASDHVSAATGKTVAVQVSKNGAAFASPAAGATNAVEVGSGWYYVDLAAADFDTLGDLVVRGTEGTIDPAERLFAVCSPRVYRASQSITLFTVGTGSTVTSVVTSSLDPAASVTDQFKGLVLSFDRATTTAALRGEKTDVTGSSSGGVLTVTSLTTAPVSGDFGTVE